jgi:hypothetical protein
MFNRRWNQKPPVGVPLNGSDSLARGIGAFWTFQQGNGPVWDLVHGASFGHVGGTSAIPWVPGPNAKAGWCLDNSSGGTVFVGYTDRRWNFTGPVTIIVGGAPLVGLNNQTIVAFDGSIHLQVNQFSSGNLSYFNGLSTVQGTTGAPSGMHTWAARQDTPSHADVWLDGEVVGSSSSMGGFAGTSTGWQMLLAQNDGSQPFHGPCSYIVIYNRALSASEMMRWHEEPWSIFGPNRVSAAIAANIVPSFSVASPTTVYAGDSGAILSLLGYNTGWVNGTTTFTVTGGTKTAQTVTDGTHATVTITTGASSTPYSVTISDGTRSTTITVEPQALTAVPFDLPTNHAGHITLTLTGFGTNWGGGTTFTVSGATKVSQSITSATSATLVVTTGSTTGHFSVSDGTSSYPITIATATLAASPGTVAASGTFTLTGAGTLWTQENPSGLFSASGPTGAGISSVAVVSNTEATLELAPSTGSGTATITDTSTTATTTIQALAITPGSLHMTSALAVGPSSGSTLFGGRSSATLAFRFKINSTTVSDNQTIIDWGTIPGTGNALLFYKPDTGLATSTIYGSTTGTFPNFTFSFQVPVQLGVGYHVLISWGPTVQVAYISGIA